MRDGVLSPWLELISLSLSKKALQCLHLTSLDLYSFPYDLTNGSSFLEWLIPMRSAGTPSAHNHTCFMQQSEITEGDAISAPTVIQIKRCPAETVSDRRRRAPLSVKEVEPRRSCMWNTFHPHGRFLDTDALAPGRYEIQSSGSTAKNLTLRPTTQGILKWNYLFSLREQLVPLQKEPCQIQRRTGHHDQEPRVWWRRQSDTKPLFLLRDADVLRVLGKGDSGKTSRGTWPV